MAIDPRLIDVEFDQWNPGDQFGGMIESDEEKSYGLSFPSSLVIPRSEWRDRIEQRKKDGYSLRNLFPYVFNQSPESSCVYNAGTRAWAIRWCVMYGNSKLIVPSPMSGYNQVARSRHSGSTMWGCMEHLTEVGFLPSERHNQDKIFDHTYHENSPFSRSMPSGWQNTARQFRVSEDGWFSINSKEEFASALLQDMPICYGRSGHSICAEDLVYDNNRYLCSSCDSYAYMGNRDQGRIFDTERKWGTGGAWCCNSVRALSQEMLDKVTTVGVRLEGETAGS